MFELRQLEQLIIIAEQGTISKAAEILHISQPALTRAMQKLEDDLNVTLFSRSKNRIKLNQTGELAVRYAYKIIEEANDMVAKLQLFERSQYTISIGTCAPGPLWQLTPLLGKYYPDMSITSEMKDIDSLTTGLDKDIYQLIISKELINDDNVVSMKFCDEHLFISVPQEHHLAQYNEITFEKLNGESFLLFSQIGFWHALCKEKMPDSLFLIQNQITALNELIKLSALPNFVTNISMKYERETNNRIIIPISDIEAKVTFYCSFKKENANKYNKLFNALK